MKGLRVQCPVCKGIFYETTDRFNPDIRPNGSFLRLLNPWRTWHWDPYDGALATSATSCSQMNCTKCGSPLAPSGRLLLLPEAIAAAGQIEPVKLKPKPKSKPVSHNKPAAAGLSACERALQMRTEDNGATI